MILPFVSMLMPTYNRAPDYLHLVAEAVEGFLRQDYPADRRELVILNDTPRQPLLCPAPGVRMVNTDKRLWLGEKRNELVRLAKGSILVIVDDDDISLPHRISQAVDALCSPHSPYGTVHHLSPQYHYFNPRRSWFWDNDGLHSNHAHGYCVNASSFTREAFNAVDGYPEITGGWEDAVVDAKLSRLPSAPPLTDDPRDWSMIYRWGVSPTHTTCAMYDNSVYERIGRRPIAEGTFMVRPEWRQNYVALTQAHCDGLDVPV